MMQSDKENIDKLSTKSKIPLPLDPLPALPPNLLKKRSNLDTEQRHPLQTINNQQINHGGFDGNVRKTKKKVITSVLKLDTRHVTIRQKNEELDWDYKVFKDDPKESSVIIVSDDEDEVEEVKKNGYIPNKQTKSFGEAKKVSTPVLSLLEPSRIKNIKRSLKRPHSRELQGISSAARKERREDGKHTWRYFNEPLHERLRSPDSIKKSYMSCLSRDYTCDMFAYLLKTEVKPIVPCIPSVTRACVINWLIKVNGADGDPATVQTACWYLDAVLGTGSVQLDKLQLVAAACYWISQKLHGPSVKASRLVKCANRAFTTDELMTVEKNVLLKLRFPRQPVLPVDYITYLSWWCDESHPGEIEVAATFLCISGMMVNKALCDEYPSVVGAAAVRNALILLGKSELLTRLKSYYLYKAAEKKTKSMSFVCLVQIKAVRLMVLPSYEYKAPFEHYGCAPHYIAQRVIHSAYELAAKDGT